MIGVIQLDGIRGQLALCTRRIKSDLIGHEIGVTQIVLALAQAAEIEVARGMDVDQRFLADAEVLVIGSGRHLMIEFDTGSMRYAQIRERWDIYRTLEAHKDILWVTATEDRRSGIRTIDHPAISRMTFATLAEVTVTPWQFIGGEA